MTGFGKTDCIVTTSETAFIAPYHRYNHMLFKTQWQHNKRWPGLLSTWLFHHRVKHWKASTDGGGPLGGCNWTAWTYIVSYKLPSSSVVICDWSGGMFGIWLELGVPLGVYLVGLGYSWAPLTRSRCQRPPPPISVVPYHAIPAQREPRRLSKWR